MKRDSLPGVRMQHPLAGTARLSPDGLDKLNGLTTDLYTVMMIRNRRCGHTSCYGHTGCDFSYASVLFSVRATASASTATPGPRAQA